MPFEVPIPQSTETSLHYPDKDQLHRVILVMRQKAMSYRKIAAMLGLHWTRIAQIIKDTR